MRPDRLVWAVLAAWAQAPEKPLLQNEGRPMVVPFACTEEDISSAGLSCTEEEPCPVYLELAAVEIAGNRFFAAGNIHTAASTLYGLLLASDDGGKTWHEPYERSRAAGLESIQFVDFENGWVAGQVLHPLPQDPFLLITSDGGKSWRRRAVFNDARFGSILQFWFASAKNGSLVIDRGQGSEGSRYELYETPNGGEVWMIRETNDRPIKLRRATPSEAWRVRADAGTKSFRIERNQGDKWIPLAAFAIGLGACKPPKPAPEPPTPGRTP